MTTWLSPKLGMLGNVYLVAVFDYYDCDTDEYDYDTDYYDDDIDEYDSDNNNSEDSPRDHDLPPTCSIAFLAGPAGDEMVIV